MEARLGRFGDRRLEKGGAFLLDRLLASGTLRVRRLGGSRAGESRITRFLRNPAVTVEEMLSEAMLGTWQRCPGRDVLVIQDTTVVRSSGRKAQRSVLAIEEKQSFRWLEGADQAASVCAGARRIPPALGHRGLSGFPCVGGHLNITPPWL